MRFNSSLTMFFVIFRHAKYFEISIALSEEDRMTLVMQVKLLK